MTDIVVPKEHSANEHLKLASNYLRGTINESLENPITGNITEDDSQLTKFHGCYIQDDRDLRMARKKKKLEPAYSFLIRIRVPGGISTSEQWVAMDNLSNSHGNGTMKLTTRQAYQLHGVIKTKLKDTIYQINEAALDTIAACGDVNRNVMNSPNPLASSVHAEVQEYVDAVSRELTPRTRAYHELWLDNELVAGGEKEAQVDDDYEPIYGPLYLPRKFKIAFAIPPRNDTDIFANDIGAIAIEKEGKLVGFNVAAGGGMGTTHGLPETYPRLASIIGFVKPEHIVETMVRLVEIQRDFGDRVNRKHARFKYTIDDRGVEWLQEEFNKRASFDLLPIEEYEFTTNMDAYGWHQGVDGLWYLGLFIEHGRIHNKDDYELKTGLRELADLHICDFRLSGNQNLILGKISDADKNKVIEVLNKYAILEKIDESSAQRLHSMACVALNTCALAMAESERYLPKLIDKIDKITKALKIDDVPINIRMTGCPNGCGRPFLGEIGFVGKSVGRYNMYLGAAHNGERLNKMYRENIDENQILAELVPLLEEFAETRNENEHFGDFVIRRGFIKATKEGMDFHQ
ncbi:MAG: NADPH-dependent assimilatory sulfite reductase hemoprotein subunit [Lentisphaeria bacterium]|nr:NADPH-dependent assimilatory sulfite reductase hemoprotein subunit [Lentisphaeria bacterium]